MVIPKERQQQLTESLFSIYIVVLVWIILFKLSFSIHNLPTMRSVNFIPFAGTAVYDGQLDYSEIIGNILIFIPYGVYLSMLKPHWRFYEKTFLMAGTSLFFETTQYVLAIGGTDITDLLGNTLGGMLGIGLFFLLNKMLKERARTHQLLNMLLVVGTVLTLISLGIIVLANN